MTILVYSSVGILLLFLWIELNPTDALMTLAHLKRRWRAYLIKRHGQHAAKEVFTALRSQAQQKGYTPEQIESVICQYNDEVVEQLGTAAAEQLLGSPTFIEANY